jgi:hypothetical protein
MGTCPFKVQGFKSSIYPGTLRDPGSNSSRRSKRSIAALRSKHLKISPFKLFKPVNRFASFQSLTD